MLELATKKDLEEAMRRSLLCISVMMFAFVTIIILVAYLMVRT